MGSEIVLNNDDVVLMDANVSLTECKTSKVEDIVDAIRDIFNSSEIDVWVDGGGGIACKILQAQGGGWKKGKVRISFRLEFIPDEPIPTSGIRYALPIDPNSPSADFRSDLGI
jgi:KGK domain